MTNLQLNQNIANALRSAYNADIEITAVFTDDSKGAKKVGYRYLISKWNKDDILERNIYSPGEHIYLTYSDALAMALERCKDELGLPATPPDIKNLKT